MAMVIILLTPLVLLRTPTDIFPDINIPVISLVWNFTGLEPTEMEQRITSNSERAVTTLVNDVEHIESQSINGIAVVKIYFQPEGELAVGVGANYGDRADHFAAAAAGDHSSVGGDVFGVNRASDSDRAYQRQPERAAAFRLWQQLHSHATRYSAGRGAALSLWRETAADFSGLGCAGAAVEGTLAE